MLANLEKMIAKHNQLILKPASGSLGGGIMKLTKDDFGTWSLKYYVARRTWSEISFKDEFPNILTDLFNKKQYIIQEKIDLATYKERPFILPCRCTTESHRKLGSGGNPLQGISIQRTVCYEY